MPIAVALLFDVCVFEGEVSVSRTGSTASQPSLVREGQAVRASEQSPTIDSAEFKVTPFEGAWPFNSGVLQSTGSIRFVSPWMKVGSGRDTAS